ncbi:TPA: RNA ligase [Campylobacter jejuni]
MNYLELKNMAENLKDSNYRSTKLNDFKFYTYILSDYKNFKENNTFFIRGLMIDSKSMLNKDTLAPGISIPMPKFFNINENEDWILPDSTNLEDFTIVTKYDGSLMIPYEYDGIKFRTKMSIDNDQTKLANKYIKNNPDILDLIKNNPGTQYFFELISPLNRIVVDYNKTELKLIAELDLRTLEFKIHETNEFNFKDLNIRTLKDLKDYINTISNYEGVILQHKVTKKVYKLKTQEYLDLHNTVTNLDLKVIYKMILEETIDDVLPKLSPEAVAYVDSVSNSVKVKLNEILDSIDSNYIKAKDLEAPALYIKDLNIDPIAKDCLFKLCRNKLNLDNILDQVKKSMLKYNKLRDIKVFLKL